MDVKRGRKRPFGLRCLLVLAPLLSLFVAPPARAEPWRFGVMADTQWTAPTDPAAKNPNSVAVSIIDQVNREFIRARVAFVIQVGDLTQRGNDADLFTRAAAAEPLYLSGIGFFPMRGNHDVKARPEGVNRYGIPAFRRNFPQTRGQGRHIYGARDFNSPTSVSPDLDGMSYSFDYGEPGGSARFVIIDNWVTPGRRGGYGMGSAYGYSVDDQQAWISSRLERGTRGSTHAFVLSHQNLMGEHHQDSLFSGYTNANPEWQNAFIASLQRNGVKYYISGHDHMHRRSIITSPDGASKVEQLICASDSSKFYGPNPASDPRWFGQKARELSLSQDLYTIGYYLFTVDGPRVSVEYFADNHGKWQSDAAYPNGPDLPDTGITPPLHFVKKETWGYILAGTR